MPALDTVQPLANVILLLRILSEAHFWIRGTSFLPDGYFAQALEQRRICSIICVHTWRDKFDTWGLDVLVPSLPLPVSVPTFHLLPGLCGPTSPALNSDSEAKS